VHLIRLLSDQEARIGRPRRSLALLAEAKEREGEEEEGVQAEQRGVEKRQVGKRQVGKRQVGKRQVGKRRPSKASGNHRQPTEERRRHTWCRARHGDRSHRRGAATRPSRPHPRQPPAPHPRRQPPRRRTARRPRTTTRNAHILARPQASPTTPRRAPAQTLPHRHLPLTTSRSRDGRARGLEVQPAGSGGRAARRRVPVPQQLRCYLAAVHPDARGNLLQHLPT